MWKRLNAGRNGASTNRSSPATAGPSSEQASIASQASSFDRLLHRPAPAPRPRGFAFLFYAINGNLYYAKPRISLDVLFIHGLGGTSLRTWCHNRDLENLWPQLWLPQELPSARILTFGYNADFSSRKKRTPLTIGDFANDLLFRMKHGENGTNRLGQVPIIVVAHSMGGLVFKKAFIQGHLNDEYRDVIRMIKAVLFLATPHRGTDLADTLNKVLAGSVFGHSPKGYVSDLAKGSPTIDELNEAFRHVASKLQIFSFYERLKTSVGPISVMIVDKNSSVMGYPGETQQPLSADHHNVCKFTGVGDPNYASVIGALRSAVTALGSPKETDSASKEDADSAFKEDLKLIKNFLGVSGPPGEDIAASRAVRKPGTCESFLACPEMKSWLGSESSRVLWAHAGPGSGKSTLCSFVIDHLLDGGHHCAYFFFNHGSREQRSVANMLRSLAYQTAIRIPAFRHALADLARSGLQIHNAEALPVWQKLYSAVLPAVKSEGDVFWVVDGVDESESSRQVVEFLSNVTDLASYIRILVFSRPLPTINQAFQVAKKRIPVVDIPLPNNADDIRLVVAGEIDYLPSTDDFKTETVDKIASRSQGNFLWTSLVLQRVARCRRQEQVKQVLDSTPDGMDKLYDRMLDAIMQLDMEDDKSLSRVLLSWAMYAKAPLTVEELSEAYSAELSLIIHLNHTVSEVCGQFVTISPDNRANEELFGKCLEALCDTDLRMKISSSKMPLFLPYAAKSWAFHLETGSLDSESVFDALVKFFSGKFPLSWIQCLATGGGLTELLGASRALTAFVRRRRKSDTERSPNLHRSSDLSLIESWAVDLMRIPAKFGRYLSEDPVQIYKCIPPLCPTSSAIYRNFNDSLAATLSVSGLSNADWDDCLARVLVRLGTTYRLAVSSLHLAIATFELEGCSITLFDTNLFEEYTTFNVADYICDIALNESGSMLSCYCLSQTFVWKVQDGSLESATNNPYVGYAADFRFDNDTLMMVSHDRRVYKLLCDREDEEPSWAQLDLALLEEMPPSDKTFSQDRSLAFNHNCTQIVFATGPSSLSVWNLDPPEMVALLKKNRVQAQRYVRPAWHPSGTLIFGISNDVVFKWNLVDDNYDELKAEAAILYIECSPNGIFFLTYNMRDWIMIYDVSSMLLVYKLELPEVSAHIRFSPESDRFYTLVGSHCSIREPSCLTRLVDAAAPGRSSTADTAPNISWPGVDDTHSMPISLPPSESHADRKPGIVSVAISCRHSDLVAYVSGDQNMNIYDPIDNRTYTIGQVSFPGDLGCLVWNRKHDQLAYSTWDSATVKAVAVRDTPPRQVSATDLYAENISEHCGMIRQLVFDETDKLLLFYGARKSRVLSFPGGEIVGDRDTPNQETAVWVPHPLKPELLLLFTAEAVAIFTWRLERQGSTPLHMNLDDASGPVFNLRHLPSYCPRFLLLAFFAISPGFIVLPTNAISSENEGGESPTPIKPVVVPRTAQHAAGILPDGRLVFLDQDLWVCTVQLHDGGGAIERHFFLPHDWVEDKEIRLCQVLGDGTFICPSKGEVAVIKSNLMSTW
ncbi:hypothetical protein QBC33DRAFT_595577 [Phialemonium atrogriseum]|uniref:Nephrocystin 3-like N-terminal domain-containing protein n=1 Tax=Phialemonium atrogriseum TaxID=1093897 RepID=A0AAJ0FJC5_9PEZI|nr:uncharacterized protein QBC33DRAFT_595577 [Phialemonium atrogriseum]KAK1764264.1 hypothetical protein QBC33DRAFT_595577 [Phialemonium atrogriseum]